MGPKSSQPTVSASDRAAEPIPLAVTIVVPTRDRPDMLARCLKALSVQTLPPERFEIVVVDDSRTRSAALVVRSAAASCGWNGHIRYLTSKAGGPAAARNLGWRAGKGHIVAFTDDDCIPMPGWLEAGLSAVEGWAEAASGITLVPLTSPVSDYQRSAARLAASRFVTANCFYRRETLQYLGGFDERFRLAWREDTDLYYRLLARGGRGTIAPDAVVIHPVRGAGWAISLRQQRKSFFNALLYKKHPTLYRRNIQRLPPIGYYLTTASLALAAGGALLRKRLSARIGLLLWFFSTARFCLCRLRGTSHHPTHVLEMGVTSILIPPYCVYWRLRGAWHFRTWFP